MPFHKYIVERIPGSDHEHGSHYSHDCESYIVSCTCGYIFVNSTCRSGRVNTQYPTEQQRLIMIEHRLDYLEQKLLGESRQRHG